MQQSDEDKNAERLAHEIINVFSLVDSACNAYLSHMEQQEQSEQLNEEQQRLNEQAEEDEFQQILLHKPLNQKYKMLLKDLRFDYVSMKDQTARYKHHYATYITPN